MLEKDDSTWETTNEAVLRSPALFQAAKSRNEERRSSLLIASHGARAALRVLPDMVSAKLSDFSTPPCPHLELIYSIKFDGGLQ